MLFGFIIITNFFIFLFFYCSMGSVPEIKMDGLID